MSNKGKTFTHKDLPRRTQQRIEKKQVNEAELKKLDAWLAAQTARNAIVAYDGDTPLIAEEVNERAVRKHATLNGAIDPAVLSLLRSVSALPDDQRYAVLAAFDKKGDLKHPFKKA
jgi:hypothetical protein